MDNALRIRVAASNPLPGRVRRQMVGTKWWRLHCEGAKGLNAHPEVTNADVAYDVTRLRHKGVWMVGPTPSWLQRVVEKADEGMAVRATNGTINLDNFVAILPGKRHDVTPTGVTRLRADGTIRGARSKETKPRVYSRGR